MGAYPSLNAICHCELGNVNVPFVLTNSGSDVVCDVEPTGLELEMVQVLFYIRKKMGSDHYGNQSSKNIKRFHLAPR